MNGFVVELPTELQSEVARRASQAPGGESAWVADAVREKLAACAQLECWPKCSKPTRCRETSVRAEPTTESDRRRHPGFLALSLVRQPRLVVRRAMSVLTVGGEQWS
jgi:hypothetical protein